MKVIIVNFFWLDPKETKDQGCRKTEALPSLLTEK
jgi:hypothetical protein